MKPPKTETNIKFRMEQVSFQSGSAYMDAVVHDGYLDLTIGGTENEKFSITIEDWEIINQKIRELLNQK